MKKIKIISILLVSLVFLNFGCSTFRITNVNKEADFSLSKYSTYNLYNLDIDTVAYEDLSERLMILRYELMVQLEKNGLTRVQNNPELLINIGIVIEDKQQTEQSYIANSRYMGPRSYAGESTEDVIGEYKEGTITFDFVKAEDNTLECMAVGEGIVVKKDKNSQKNIEKTLKKLLKEINKE